MNKMEQIAIEASDMCMYDDYGYLENHHELKNLIYERVCEEFADSRLPPDNLLERHNIDFEEDSIGEWGDRLNKAARTMQTIYNRALDIAGGV